MSTRIPQLDGGGGYEKDDDYNAPDEEESEEEESLSSSASDLSDDDDDEEEESISDSDERGSPSSRGLRERKSPRIAAAAEEESLSSNSNKRRTRQTRKGNAKNYQKRTEQQSKISNKGPGGGRGRGRPRKAKNQEDLNPKTLANTKEIANKMEEVEEDGAFLCANCKKRFPTKVALNNHAYWCAPKRITRSRRGGGGTPAASRPGPSKNNRQAKQNSDENKPKKRGRKPRAATNNTQPVSVNVNNLEEEVSESEDFIENNAECDEELVLQNNDHIAPHHPEEWADSTEESDYETKVNCSDSQPIFESESGKLGSATYETEDAMVCDENEESEIPVSCSNCKMTYRNVASLKKHLAACMYVSSSASEDENQDGNNAESQDINDDELEDPSEQQQQQLVVQGNENLLAFNTPSSFFSNNLQLGQNAVIKVTQPDHPQMQLITGAEKSINSFAPFQQNITHAALSTNSVYVSQAPNPLNAIVPSEFSSTATVLSESQPQPMTHVEDKKITNEGGEYGGPSFPQLNLPSAVQVFNSNTSASNEGCLLKQALSSSMYSTVPGGSNYQYTFAAQNNLSPGMPISRPLGQPIQNDSINIAAQNTPAQLSSLSLSHRPAPEGSIRSDTTTGVSNSTILQEQYKSFNNLGPANFQPQPSNISNYSSPTASSTQLQISENSSMGPTLHHHQVTNNSEMNQQADKLLHLPNSDNTVQRFVHQNPDYLMSSKFSNSSTAQNDIIRFNIPGGNGAQSLMPQQVNKPQPAQVQPTIQAYQTVTIQGENGQLYRVNIPVPQNAISFNMQANIDGSNDQTQKDMRNPYNSTQLNYPNNIQTPQQQAIQGGGSSANLDGHQHFRRVTYSTLNSESSHSQGQQHINAAHGNSQLNSVVNNSNPAIPQQLRQSLNSNTNSFSEYSQPQHSQEFSRLPQHGPIAAPFQPGNSSQGQELISSSQNHQLLQQKQLASQLGIQFTQEQVIKQTGEQTGLAPNQQQIQGFTNSINFMNSPLALNTQQNQHTLQTLQHHQIMYQQEIARQQQLLQQQQSEQQAQKHYQDLQQQQQQQSINAQTKQDVLSMSGTPGFLSQNIGSSPISSQMVGGNPYNTNSPGLGFGQPLPTQFDQNYLMQQSSSNPSFMSHVQKMQHSSQGQSMNVQQGVYNRLIVPQNNLSTQPTLPSEPRSPFPSVDGYNQSQSIQNIKPGPSTPSSAMVAQTNNNPGQPQVNIPVPYQIIQGPDGTTYIIVQSSSSVNVQSNASNLGTRPTNTTGVLSHNNISDIVQSALISNQSNVNSAIQSLQGSSFHIETPCTANTLLNHPCICSKCAISRSSVAAGPEKYRKVLPSPRPIEPKVAPTENQISSQQPSSSESSVPLFVKTYMKKHAGKTVKTQLANMIMEKQTINCVSGDAGDTNIILNQMNEEISPNSDAGALRKNPVLTAVVRPMEHPLQKMSDQISQIESIFSGTPTLVPVRSIESPATLSENERKDTRGMTHSAQSSSTSPAVEGSNSNEQPTPQDSLPAMQRTPVGTGVKRKGEPLPTSPAKSIKVTLKRKERGDSYCINDISETGASSGPMRSIKIKAKITTGELAGTSTDVVVEPKIHIVPIPDPDSDDIDSNLTIAENDAPIVGPILSGPAPDTQDAESNGAKLTHRAVVVYEVKCNNKIQYRSSNVRAIWSYVFGTVQWARLSHNLPPISYPATNISLENKRTPTTNFNVGGLIHRAVQFLIQYLPKESSATDKQQFPFPQPTVHDESVVINETGCARTEGFVGRKPFDMFGWLASKHRKPLEKLTTSDEPWKNNGVPMAVRFRTMKAKTKNTLTVMWSTIHGRGLYTRRSIEKGEMIIEYAGEVIRSLVCDQREKYYETKSIGCYMFRIDEEYVIDATMKGNAARFINHSCEPNCESKSLKILGKDRIMIFALRKISSGEELTYDYKFEKEDVKIPCACGSTKCRKYLN